MTTIGILGVGHLAGLMMRGLAGSDYRLVLSPRNAEVAAQLAGEHGCEIADSNQALVDYLKSREPDPTAPPYLDGSPAP